MAGGPQSCRCQGKADDRRAKQKKPLQNTQILVFLKGEFFFVLGAGEEGGVVSPQAGVCANFCFFFVFITSTVPLIGLYLFCFDLDTHMRGALALAATKRNKCNDIMMGTNEGAHARFEASVCTDDASGTQVKHKGDTRSKKTELAYSYSCWACRNRLAVKIKCRDGDKVSPFLVTTGSPEAGS